jgi:hypothetical protein
MGSPAVVPRPSHPSSPRPENILSVLVRARIHARVNATAGRPATCNVSVSIYLSTPNSSRKVITTLFYFLTYISPFILLESQLNKTKREWRNSPVPDFHATAAWISASSTSISCRQAVSEGRGPSCPRASRGESMSQ